MKPSTLANIAIGLVPIGWLASAGGILMQLGDFAPGTSADEIRWAHVSSQSAVGVGLICLIAVCWLSGFTFKAARLRSMLVIASVALPTIGLIAWSLVE